MYHLDVTILKVIKLPISKEKSQSQSLSQQNERTANKPKRISCKDQMTETHEVKYSSKGSDEKQIKFRKQDNVASRRPQLLRPPL
jgi:hypothetical protein